MAVTKYALPTTSGPLVTAGTSPQVFFHGITCRASGGEVFITPREGDEAGMSFYPIHLLDGESRADPPFVEGIIVNNTLYLEIEGGEFLVGGAVFVKDGS